MVKKRTKKIVKKKRLNSFHFLAIIFSIGIVLFLSVFAAINIKAGRPNKDNIPPILELISPLQGSTVSGIVPVEFNATDNVGIAKIEIHPDGVAPTTVTSFPYRVDWDTTILCNGMKSFYAKAYDLAGNIQDNVLVYSVNISNPNQCPPSDTIAPIVTLDPPTGFKTFDENKILITVLGIDNMGISRYEIYADNALVCGFDDGGSETLEDFRHCYWTVPKLQGNNNSHTLKGVVKDKAGNTSFAESVITSK